MIFDEVVSTLDIETAYEIEKMILDYSDKTVIFVSHNFSGKLIKTYDEILVMDGGKLLAHGTYDELYDKAVLDLKQQILADKIDERPEVSVVWFRPDEKKDGGQYVTTTGQLKKVDDIERTLRLADGTMIPLDDVLELRSDCFRGVFQDG